MALRIRKDGQIVCAAMHPEQAGDTYLHDGLSYQLRVKEGVVIDDVNHEQNGLCYWRSDVMHVVRANPNIA